MIETPRISDPSLIYMYGLSDFWAEMFGDTELVESVLSASTITLAEVYSYFLQRAAGISLSDVQSKYSTRIKLLTLNEDSATDSSMTTFKIDPTLSSIDKLSNRPILPTQVLDLGIHYEIIDNTIRFYKPISELRFPVRITSTGKSEYAIWMTDVEINEKWIDNTFGRLVGFTEDDAIFNYKSFLEGVYYLYANGPNISYIERGVNLAMGMPYARATEPVLDLTKDAVTGNWVIFTNTQSYELPYGYHPDITVGDILTENRVLTTWVEVRDHTRNGAWWYDIYLPQEVLGSTVNPKSLGRCSKGSAGDKIMETFLKHHMFEVLISQPNGDISAFNTAKNLVMRAKPEYTFPVFIWKVPLLDDEVDIIDDFSIQIQLDLADTMLAPPSIRYMDRSTEDPHNFVRGQHRYNRMQGSMYAAGLLGYGDSADSAGWSTEFEDIDTEYLSYMDVLMRGRGDTIAPTNRGTVTRGWRGHVANLDPDGHPLPDTIDRLDWHIAGANVVPRQADEIIVSDRDLTPLYMLTTGELVSKMLTIDSRFYIKQGEFKYVVRDLNMPEVYDTWIVRNSDVLSDAEDKPFEFVNTKGGLDVSFSDFANQSYVPRRSEMYHKDGTPITDGKLFITKNSVSVWTVQWVRDEFAASPTLFPVEDSDNLEATEVYEGSRNGTVYTYDDKAIAIGQQDVLAPVILGVEANAIVIVGGYHIPTRFANVNEDGIRLRLLAAPRSTGYISWFPWKAHERVLPTDGATYYIPETITDREDLLISMSATHSNYLFTEDYTISNPAGGGTDITLGTAIPVGGDVIVSFADHTGIPARHIVPAGQTTHTIHTGYALKIFTGGRLLSHEEYSVSGSTLTLHILAVDEVSVRYYKQFTRTQVAPFNRSTVQLNSVTCLKERNRPSADYTARGEDTVYMTRGGMALTKIPELGEAPVYADSIKVHRRLR